MPLPIIEDVYRCALRYSSDDGGEHAVNVFHVRSIGSTASDVWDAINNSFDAGWWDAIVSTTASVVGADVTPLDGITPTFTQDYPTPKSGSAGNDYSPASAAIVTEYTAFRGKSNRGRMFIPFIAESVITDGFVNSTPRTTAGAGVTAFVSQLDIEGAPMVVASYLGAGSANSVTSTVLRRVLGTQRLRQSRLRRTT